LERANRAATVACFFGGVQRAVHPSFVRSGRLRNRGGQKHVTTGVELFLIVLLVLMIPGLVTYLVRPRDPNAERADS
jgi:hypothetical protein